MTGSQTSPQHPSRWRILMVISDLEGGGAERQFSLLAGALSRRCFEPHLCFWRPVFRYPYPQDAPVHVVPKDRAWDVFSAVRGTRRLIEDLRPQLVFSQLHYVNMVVGTALARSRHRPRWVCRQVNDPRREMRGPFAIWARWALRRADRVVACSQGVRRQVVEHLRTPPERVVQIDNLADVDAIERLSGEPLEVERSPGVFTVVHAGRLERQKNQALLLDAFARFKGQRAELWMLGEGPLEGSLRDRSERLGITSQVRWLGFRDNPFPFFRAADCLVLSSDFEGLPNVVIEAMICGTPCVATRCPFGPEELIDDGETGLLVPVGDVDKLSEKLGDLARQPEVARRLGAAARERSTARFGVGRISRAYEELFASVAGG